MKNLILLTVLLSFVLALPAFAGGTCENLIIDIGGGTTLEMVLIKAGTFRMGNDNESADEKPVHTVNITNPFYLGKYEVTQGQWKKIMGTNPSFFQTGQNGISADTDTELYPVEQVSWNDCQEFIKKLNGMNKATGAFRLPSEAEWEYSCRAGTNTKYFWGDEIDGKYCCYDENSNGTAHRISNIPNGFGLCDMSGNVWEWCADSCNYDNGKIITDTYAGEITDPLCKTGSYRVFRGGSWYYDAGRSRSSIRDFGVPSIQNNSLGLRLCLFPGR